MDDSYFSLLFKRSFDRATHRSQSPLIRVTLGYLFLLCFKARRVRFRLKISEQSTSGSCTVLLDRLLIAVGVEVDVMLIQKINCKSMQQRNPFWDVFCQGFGAAMSNLYEIKLMQSENWGFPRWRPPHL